MIANFFKQSKPIVFVILVFILSLLFVVEALQVVTLPVNLATVGVLGVKYLLLILCYVLYDFILKHFEIQKGHSYGSLFFVLFSSFILPEVFNSYIIFGFVLFFIGLYKLLNIVKSEQPTLTIFESVFFFFSASLFYPPFIFVLILVLVVTLEFANPHWRYFVIPLLAISAVIVLLELFSLIWYDKFLPANFFWPKWQFKILEFNSNSEIFSFVIWSLLIIIFVHQAFKVLQKRALYHQKMATSFLYLALFAFLSSWFSISKIEGLWMIAIVPMSIYLGDFIFRLPKKLLKEIYLWAFILLAILFSII